MSNAAGAALEDGLVEGSVGVDVSVHGDLALSAASGARGIVWAGLGRLLAYPDP